MLLQSIAMAAKKLLVYYKITACVRQICLLGVVIEKHCLMKCFVFLSCLLSIFQFCALSNYC